MRRDEFDPYVAGIPRVTEVLVCVFSGLPLEIGFDCLVASGSIPADHIRSDGSAIRTFELHDGNYVCIIITIVFTQRRLCQPCR